MAGKLSDLKVRLRAAKETVPLEEYLLRYAVLDGHGNLDGHFIPINIARIACEHLIHDELEVTLDDEQAAHQDTLRLLGERNKVLADWLVWAENTDLAACPSGRALLGLTREALG
jgi:hypothetical protein